MTDPVRTSGERLGRRLEAMAAIGAQGDGGVRRLAATAEDAAGRAQLLAWASERGYASRRDRVGNLFVRRAGDHGDRPAVMIGSHLDTQPGGGRYDGALGVLAGLEVLETLDDHGVRTAAPVDLAVWTDEEGARFDVSCIGSSVFSGALALDRALALVDADGETLGAALRRHAMLGDEVPGRRLPAAYLELHIEQGPVLERTGQTIGIPTGIPAIEWLEVELHGREAHTGTTPMDDRRDALLAAARLIVAVDEIARRHGDDARGTVCRIDTSPGSGSVVNGSARLLVDLRHPDVAQLEAMRGALVEAVPEGVRVETRRRWAAAACRFDEGLRDTLRRVSAGLGHDPRPMLSGAGHDAGYLAGVVPGAMLFVPSRGGVSHHPDEHTDLADAAAGADVLLGAVLDLATATTEPLCAQA